MCATTSRSRAASPCVEATSTDLPLVDSACSTAATIAEKNGSATDSTTMPTAVSVPDRRDRAIASGVNFRSRIACWTLARVAIATRGSSLSTRDAVRRLTPATSATSRRMLLATASPLLCHRWHKHVRGLPSMARMNFGAKHYFGANLRSASGVEDRARQDVGRQGGVEGEMGDDGRRAGHRQPGKIRRLVGELGRVPCRIALSQPAQHLGRREAQPDQQRLAACRGQPSRAWPTMRPGRSAPR